MSEELNCMNCSIGDFKHDLCDCDNGFCKEFKSIGKQEDFFNAVMQRIRPQGEWIYKDDDVFAGEYTCSNCNRRAEVDLYGQWILSNYCPSCGARMKGADDEVD